MKRALVPLLLLAVAGCGGDDQSPDEEPDDPQNQPAGDGDGDDAMLPSNLPSNCVVDLEHFRSGLTSEGEEGAFVVRIEDAEHIPARKYENNWTVAILDSEGNAMPDAELMDVWPFMPAHQHGSQTTTVIEDLGDGAYQVDKIDLWMDGGWQVHFEVKIDGTVTEAVVDVCIPK